MAPVIRAAAALLTLSLLPIACAGPAQTIGIGQNIHHDDFEYTVRQVEKLDHIGALKPAGVFYVVTFQVENRAKRVGHDWDNTLAYLSDERGREYENNASAQRALNDEHPFGWRDHYHTGAGDTDTTRFVFDLPEAAAQPYLRVRGETLMGDVLDGRQFRRTRVKLY